jgi:uncharacterized protein with HEPN domain
MCEKIEFVLQRIDFIFRTVEKAGYVTKALEDEITYRPAILMHLSQIGEEMSKIDSEILSDLDLISDAKGAYDVRNFIVHNYEGVNLALVERIIKEKLPLLKDKFHKYIKENCKG